MASHRGSSRKNFDGLELKLIGTRWRKRIMKITKILGFVTIFLPSMVAWAQEFPRTEIGVNYSYIRFSPSVAYSKGHSLNGGGVSAVFNFNEYLGLKMDLQGSTSNLTNFNIPAN